MGDSGGCGGGEQAAGGVQPAAGLGRRVPAGLEGTGGPAERGDRVAPARIREQGVERGSGRQADRDRPSGRAASAIVGREVAVAAASPSVAGAASRLLTLAPGAR